MRMPVQPKYEEFLPHFLRALFEPGDIVNVARLVPSTQPDKEVDRLDASHLRDDAIKFLLPCADLSNYYFGASAVDGTGVYGKRNCVLARAFYLDIDYGKTGHRKAGAFERLEDVLGYLLTMPLLPSIAWATGHGVQAAYLLKDPYRIDGQVDRIERYERVGKRLGRMAMADDTFTIHHLFRVPLSLNHKFWLKKPAPEVRGELLWMESERKFAFEQIEAAVAGYGIDDHMAQARLDTLAELAGDEEDEAKNDPEYVPFDKLPEDIRKLITEEPDDRSQQFWDVIGKMVRLKYGDKTIFDAVDKGSYFHDKYDTPKRFKEEFDRCLAKQRNEKRAYEAELAPHLRGHNKPVQVAMAECAALPQNLSDMLGRYDKACGIELGQRVYDAARFHEHMFQSQKEGVLESPCGSGKSTWALAHIVLNASTGNQYIYVSETVDALYAAAGTLEKLTQTPVGRVHGFNREKCHELCDTWHTWQECNPKSAQSACRTCAQRAACAFFNRDAERGKPIVCMTHEGLRRAIEENSALLEDASILVDEGLDPFATWDVLLSDLKLLRKGCPDIPLEDFFPYSSFACEAELSKRDVASGVDVFAQRNYVYRNERQTAALRAACTELRNRLRAPQPILDPFKSGPADEDRVREVLADLLNFFRLSAAGDAAYAFHETNDDRGHKFTLKRMRFQLDVPRKYRKLWQLNASAQLSAFPYPENLKVYACPDLPGNSHLVTLHVLHGNPTKKNREQNIWMADVVMGIRSALELARHLKVLVTTDKGADLLDDIKAKVQAAFKGAEIVHLTRGRIKGVNTAGACTFAMIAGMPLFTTIDDFALHAALLLRRTYPDRPLVRSKKGTLSWNRGGPRVPAIRQAYALRALDELYQTIYRAAVRNDLATEAIVAVPDLQWLLLLWTTVMPRFNLGLAYKRVKLAGESDDENGEEQDDEAPQKVDGKPEETATEYYERDAAIDGLRVICSPPGTEFPKQQLADMFSDDAEAVWKDVKGRAWPLLKLFFEEGSTNRVMRRKKY